MQRKSKYLFILPLAASFLISSLAFGVTKNKKPHEISEFGYMAASISERAESDIQIRKLKNLVLSQEIDVDEAIKKLESLQKSSRAE